MVLRVAGNAVRWRKAAVKEVKRKLRTEAQPGVRMKYFAIALL